MNSEAKVSMVNIDTMAKYIDAKPLYVDDKFNKEGKLEAMRYMFTASNGKETYALYIVHRGTVEADISQSTDLKYNLYALVDGWAVPLGITEYILRKKAAQMATEIALYGGEEGQREFCCKIHREHSIAEAEKLMDEQRAKELETEGQFLYDNVCIADYITSRLQWHIQDYLAYKDGAEHHSLNFVGAVFANDLDHCSHLYEEREKERERKREEQRRKYEEEERRKLEAALKKKAGKLNKAEKVLLDGGIISDGSIICDLALRHDVKIPYLTSLWIANSFDNCEIREGTIAVCFHRFGKTRADTKIYDVIREITEAIRKSKSKETATENKSQTSDEAEVN